MIDQEVAFLGQIIPRRSTKDIVAPVLEVSPVAKWYGLCSSDDIAACITIDRKDANIVLRAICARAVRMGHTTYAVVLGDFRGLLMYWIRVSSSIWDSRESGQLAEPQVLLLSILRRFWR